MSLPLSITDYNKGNKPLVLDEVNLMWNIDHVVQQLLYKVYDELGFEYNTLEEDPMHCKSEKWNHAVDTLTDVFESELEKHRPKGSNIAWVKNP